MHACMRGGLTCKPASSGLAAQRVLEYPDAMDKDIADCCLLAQVEASMHPRRLSGLGLRN